MKKTSPTPKTPPSKRAALLQALDTMPDEAFGWVLVALSRSIFPDGLGGFTPESRASIVAVKAEANKVMEQMG